MRSTCSIIDRSWHFGDRLGDVPEDFPAAPLQQDLAALQKRLRLPPKAEEKTLDLDLREPFDRERSHLLRRLRLLGIEWGEPATHHSGGRGTFHELWQIALAARVRHCADRSQPLRPHRRAGSGGLHRRAQRERRRDTRRADRAARRRAVRRPCGRHRRAGRRDRESRGAVGRRAAAARCAAPARQRASLRQRARDRRVAGRRNSATGSCRAFSSALPPPPATSTTMQRAQLLAAVWSQADRCARDAEQRGVHWRAGATMLLRICAQRHRTSAASPATRIGCFTTRGVLEFDDARACIRAVAVARQCADGRRRVDRRAFCRAAAPY